MTDDEAGVDRERRTCEVLAAYFEAQQGDVAPPRHELFQLHPELATELGEFLDEQDRLLSLTELIRSPGDDGPSSPRFGDYDLVAPIGRGGMGVVFKARQRSLNRPVALKLTLAGGDDLRRFHAEAEAGAHLDHPNIVPIYEVGEHRGQAFLSMKLIEGGNLSDSWPRCRYRAPSRRSAGRHRGPRRAPRRTSAASSTAT